MCDWNPEAIRFSEGLDKQPDGSLKPRKVGCWVMSAEEAMEINKEKIDGISIILTNDEGRWDLWKQTLDKYAELGLQHTKYEIICASRTLKSFEHKGLKIRVIPYDFTNEYFDPSLGTNIALYYAKYPSVIVTCPEVMPLTDVFSQFRELPLGNYGTKAFDENANGDRSAVLISTAYRPNLPGTAFLGIYNKEDLLKVNGWDLKFLRGHSWSDTSFSTCWNNQGIQWTIKDDIQTVHLYHVRNNSSNSGYSINRSHHEQTVRDNETRAHVGYEETTRLYQELGMRTFDINIADTYWKEYAKGGSE